MATIVGYTQVQYSGIWSLSGQANAQALGTWAVQPNTLFAWGGNSRGELGLGNQTSYSSPKQVTATSNWIAVSSSYNSSFGIKKGGTLWAWGSNRFGVLGLGNETNYSSPKQVGSLSNWSQVFNSSYQTLAVKTDGTLWSWGWGYFGQLGLGNRTSYSSPKQVGTLTNWLSVATGYGSGYAIKTDGTMWSWGYNGSYGKLGLGNTTYAFSSPQQVGSLTTWTKVVGGQIHAFALKTDGTLWSWGGNNYGQLGLGNTTYYSSPKQIGALTNWASITGGKFCSLAVKTDGTLWAWGRNDFGQLGQGNITDRSSPVQIGALTTWSLVSANLVEPQGVAALKTDGTLWGWGDNSTGKLGLGNTTDYSSPKQIGASTAWTQVAMSGVSMLAVQG